MYKQNNTLQMSLKENNMKLLTCASYHGTGSSAVTNLLEECDNVHNLGDYEFRFVQDPDGICDLEYNLVINNHRLNSGYAIKRYMKVVDFQNGNFLSKRYRSFFGNKWKELSEAYIKELVDAEFKGRWHYDLIDKGKVAWFIDRTVNKLYRKILGKKAVGALNVVLRDCVSYVTNPREKFYEATKEYIDKLFATANVDNKEFVMADQLVPPSNTMHYLKFFNDLKVICVERDPRDLYALGKTVWKSGVLPTDPINFCKWYKATRAHRQHEHDDSSKVLRIQFEDMIFKYADTKKMILEFCGIGEEHHIRPLTMFDPRISVKNTQAFKSPKVDKNEIKFIENELQGALYDFNGAEVKL